MQSSSNGFPDSVKDPPAHNSAASASSGAATKKPTKIPTKIPAEMPAVGLGAEQMWVAQVLNDIEPAQSKMWLKEILRCASRYICISRHLTV